MCGGGPDGAAMWGGGGAPMCGAGRGGAAIWVVVPGVAARRCAVAVRDVAARRDAEQVLRAAAGLVFLRL